MELAPAEWSKEAPDSETESEDRRGVEAEDGQMLGVEVIPAESNIDVV